MSEILSNIRLLTLVCCLIAAPTLFAKDIESVILEVIINGHNEGSQFLQLTADDDVLIPVKILKSFRLKKNLWDKKSISLRSLSKDLQFSVDRNNATLNIAVTPNWFEPQVIVTEKPQPFKAKHAAISPQSFSGFINYQFDSSFSEQFDSLNIPWELGVNMGRWFASNTFNSKYTKADGANNARLQSQLIWDDTSHMNRLIIGDFSAPFSGAFGSGGLFGGISLQRNFGLNRKFKYTPDYDLQTIIEKPSHAELYVNKRLVEEWDLLPGEVIFPKLSNYIGQGEVELLLTDPFGQEQRIQQTFRSNQRLLKPELHEYSYSLGFNRENIGTKSNQYGKLAFLGFHRYGFNSNMTTGLVFEANKQVINLAPTLDANIKGGLLNTALAFSHEDGKTGYRFLTGYSYNYKKFNTYVSFDSSSQEYTNLNLQIKSNNLTNKNHYRSNLTMSYNTYIFGGLSLAYSESNSWNNTISKQLSLSYNRQFSSGLLLSLGTRHNLVDNNDNTMFLTLRYIPRRKSKNTGFYDNLHYNIRSQENIEQELSIKKSFPRAKGYGYNTRLTHKDDEIGMAGRFQYRNEQGIYTGNYTYSAGDADKAGFSYAGSLALINGNLHVGRPIHDSFALVQATGLNNVEVHSNGSQVGTTNSNGNLLVSELTSYQENRLSIYTKNIPLNYNLKQREQYVQVGQRSGSLVTFEITKFTAVEGNLYLPNGKALELFPLEINVNGKKQESFTGNDGYFYLEKIPVGEHNLRILRAEGDCIAKLKVPETEKIVASLGKLTCKINGVRLD